MIRFACDTCKEKLVVPDLHAGRRGKCPNCGALNRVPMHDAPGPAAAGPARAPRATRGPALPQSGTGGGSPTSPEFRPGFIERLLNKLARKPRPDGDADLLDAGGIPRAVKVLFVVGILVLVPLTIGAAFVMLILLRVKLGN
jgi:hypothetical protein